MSERVSDESMSAIVVALRARAAACDCGPDCAEPSGCGTLIAAADVIEQACRERDEAQETLDRVLGKDPCPKCGSGIAATCYGCARDAALAQVAALRKALAFAVSSWRSGESPDCGCAACANVKAALADPSAAAAAWEQRVRSAEAERCAKVADRFVPNENGPWNDAQEMAHRIAAAIRQGGEDV